MNLKQQTIAQFVGWVACGIVGAFLGDFVGGLWVGVAVALLIPLLTTPN